MQRIIDTLPLTIEQQFLQTFADHLLDVLVTEAKEKNSQELADLMREDPEISKKRDGLEKKIDQLAAIRKRLDVIYPV
jgi:hypothetical protein